MKKQHFFRLSAILLFLSMVLGIMPRIAPTASAEETASVLPEDGKTYVMWGTWVSNKTTTKPRTYGMHPLGIRNGVNISYLSTNGYPPYFVNTCFTFEEVETGVFKILPVSMPGFCLQVGNIWTNGEATTHAAVFENKPEQLWTLKPCEGGYYLSCMSAPDQVLGNSGGGIQPIPIDSKDRIIFSFEEATVEFPDSTIYVKAPEGWHPGLWVTPTDLLEDTLKWGGFAIMEENADGWFSYPAPWDSNCDCDIVNQAVTGAGAQGYKHDERFTLEGIDFSTDKWVVITDDPNVEGDLTYQVYDYNPDDPPPEEDPLPKEGVLYTLTHAKTGRYIGVLEFAVYHNSIDAETLLCGPLIPNWYDTTLSYKTPHKKQLESAFSFKEIRDGYYAIIPANAPDVCLQVNTQIPSKTVSGSKFDNKPEQLWKIIPCEGGIQISNAAYPDLVLGLPDQESGLGKFVCMTTGEWVFALEQSEIVFPEQQIHVKAPDFWAPCCVSGFDFAFMLKGEDGWHSYYYAENSIKIENTAISSPMAQVFPTDFSVRVQIENPDRDYWIVITDDPNVEGDLTYKVYDYNPDEPPKTADPVILALPAFTLLTSAIALSCLLRRRKTV